LEPEEDLSSLRKLLIAFNSFDQAEKGLIGLNHVEDILDTRNIPSDKGTAVKI
jgi:Ca2+-binding EF-hand superfamily protein